jgi:hypothetical protein
MRFAPYLRHTGRCSRRPCQRWQIRSTPEARSTCSSARRPSGTFSRGQRLGDLRRLIRDYGRVPTNTFPEGTHYRGGTYGTDVNLPVPQQEENNPNFTRAACDQTAA